MCRIQIGRTPPRKEARYWTQDLERPFCTIADMADRHINPSREGVTQAAESEGRAKRVPAGALLMSFKLTIGRVGFAARDLFPNEAIAWLSSADPALNEEFLALWLEAQDLSQGSGRAVKGSTLNSDSLRAIPVMVPPLEVQRRIVDLIGSIDESVVRLDQERQAVDRCWWSVAAALESAASSVISMPLGQVAEISGGLTKNKKAALVGVPVVVPYLRVANVHRRFLDLTDLATITTTTDVVERLRLKPGDVLLNEGGDKDKLGRGAVWSGEVENCIHQNHVFRARITDDRFLAEFVSAWANSFGQRWFETYGTQTTGIASISKATLSKFPVPVLPKDEQMRWAAALDGVFEEMTQLAAEAGVLRELRARILDGLLSRAVEIPEAYDQLALDVMPVDTRQAPRDSAGRDR